MGLFVTMTEGNLDNILDAVAEGLLTLRALPSWWLVSRDEFGPMKSEVSSLVQLSREELSSANTVSWSEAQALSAQAEGSHEGIRWRQGPSPFDDESI